MRPCANAECGKELREGQGRFCSNPCRIAGMRAAKAAKLQPEPSLRELAAAVIERVEQEQEYHPPATAQIQHDDWRRPKQDREAMLSWHRRPIERL